MALKTKKQKIATQLSKDLSNQNEVLLKNNVSTFFKKLRIKILEAIDDYWETLFFQGQVDLILSPIHEAHQEYYNLLLKHNLQEFNRGANEGKLLAKEAIDRYDFANKSQKKKPVEFNKGNLFATQKFTEEKLKNDTFVASDKTLARVDQSIRGILEEGYQEGWGVKDVGERINERFTQLESWEANRIARTEMQYSHNLGIMNGYEEMGVEYVQWRSANQPGRTRTSHLALSGEIVPLGSQFSNELYFAGDKSGRIEEWINCRCSNPPFIMPPNKVAPPGMSQFRESDLVTIQEPNYKELLDKAIDTKTQSSPIKAPTTQPSTIYDYGLLDLEDELIMLMGLLEKIKDESKRQEIIQRINQLRSYLTE